MAIIRRIGSSYNISCLVEVVISYGNVEMRSVEGQDTVDRFGMWLSEQWDQRSFMEQESLRALVVPRMWEWEQVFSYSQTKPRRDGWLKAGLLNVCCTVVSASPKLVILEARTDWSSAFR